MRLQTPSSAPSWSEATPIDLSDYRNVDDPLFFGDFPALQFAVTSQTAPDGDGIGVSTELSSYLDFSLSGSSTRAIVLATLFDGSVYRSFGRTYIPSRAALTRSGWSSALGESGFLDLGTSSASHTALTLSDQNRGFGIVATALESAASVQVFQYETQDGFGQWSASSSNGIINPQDSSVDSMKRRLAAAWDSAGRAYVSYVQNTNTGYLQRSASLGNWSATWSSDLAGLGPYTYGATSQTQVHSDLQGVTSFYLSAGDLKSVWTADDSITPTLPATHPVLSNDTVQNFSSATDKAGNAVAVYTQSLLGYLDPPSGAISTLYPVRLNRYRIYASYRGASGIWIGPSRIDDLFDLYTTTVYQTSFGDADADGTNEPADGEEIVGGSEYAAPQVVALSPGKFLAVFALTDLSEGTSGIYSRTFEAGSGWNPSSETATVEQDELPSTLVESFRYANALHLSSDGNGNAVLAAQVVVDPESSNDYTQRAYELKVFHYTNGTWSQGNVISGSRCEAHSEPFSADPPLLDNNLYFCWRPQFQIHLFDPTEALLIFGAPANTTNRTQQIRLYSSRYL